MHYANTDHITGIKVIAEHEPGQAYTVTIRVPAYDGTDDEQSLRMQVRAAAQVVLALNRMDRVSRTGFRSVGRNMWRLVAQGPRWLEVRGVVAYPAALC